MRSEELFQQILFGGSLEDKLAGKGIAWESIDWSKAEPLIGTVDAPGRGPGFQITSQQSSAFPRKSELKDESARGRLIHFFANHELLAIESMAYVLLKFPNAEPSFRAGVFRTLQDEQRHLNAYLTRMRECGVDFGAVPLTLYFWNTVKAMKSPLDYVTQMSLTFEQANLDFALEYAKIFEEEIADEKTARLLREVHEDEVQHVAHGLKWFKNWHDPALSDYEAYLKQLPFPMTPRRAKGSTLFSAESRKQAGMSEEFIESIRVSGGSRGKVPHYYFFNPQCEVEGQLQTLPKTFLGKIEDLKPLVLWLAGEEDVIEVTEKPPLSWLKNVHALRGEIPEFILKADDLKRYQAFDEFKPWGFGESAWKKWAEIERMTRKKPAFPKTLHREKLFSKTYWKKVLSSGGVAIHSVGELDAFLPAFESANHDWLVKSDQSTSGRGHLRIPAEQVKDPVIRQKLKSRLEKGESFVVEPFLTKVQDFSVQYEISPEGRIREFEPRYFEIDAQFQYRGALLGRPVLPVTEKGGQAWIQIQKDKKGWREKHLEVLNHLKSLSYHGPVGIDALVHETSEGLKVEPVIEVNVRYTMGRVAHAIEEAFQSHGYKSGVLRFLNQSDVLEFGAKSFLELATKLKSEFQDAMIEATPAETSQSTWCFAVGSRNFNPELLNRFFK